MDNLSRYSQVSSLYGPGAVGCWLFTLCSVLVTWTLNLRSRRKDTITNDFIAMISLPAVAAVHLVYQVFRFPGNSSELLTSRNADLVQYSAAIEAPLNVCETFSAFALAFFAIAALRGHRKRAVCVLIVGLLSFSTEVILFVRAADTTVSASNFARPFVFNFMEAMVVVLAFLGLMLLMFFLCMIFLPVQELAPPVEDQVRRIRGRDEAAMRVIPILTLVSVPVLFISAFLSATGVLGVTEYGSAESFALRLPFFIPKSSASLQHLDQAVALAAGIVTLAFSMHDTFKTRRTTCQEQVALQVEQNRIVDEHLKTWTEEFKELHKRLEATSDDFQKEELESFRRRIMAEMMGSADSSTLQQERAVSSVSNCKAVGSS